MFLLSDSVTTKAEMPSTDSRIPQIGKMYDTPALSAICTYLAAKHDLPVGISTSSTSKHPGLCALQSCPSPEFCDKKRDTKVLKSYEAPCREYSNVPACVELFTKADAALTSDIRSCCQRGKVEEKGSCTTTPVPEAPPCKKCVPCHSTSSPKAPPSCGHYLSLIHI